MGFESRAVDIILIVVMVLIMAAMSIVIPDAITDAGFTGAGSTIVGLIPMMIPVGVIVYVVMDLVESFKGFGGRK